MFQNKKILFMIMILVSIITGILGISSLSRGSTGLGIVLLVVTSVIILTIIGFEQYMRLHGSQDYDPDSDPNHQIAKNYARDVANANIAKNN